MTTRPARTAAGTGSREPRMELRLFVFHHARPLPDRAPLTARITADIRAASALPAPAVPR
ncbi:hypothetical protein ACIQWZ_33510 [Streptomyces sp. NPDC098077]|uniref:hypothetical protein n=1 Tax=Streptomyces sp. NPDC098077 TaxID=3366093 RepID=UPI003814144A